MIRPATPADVPELLAMISELAAYNKAPDAAVATEEQLHEALFGEHPAVFAHLATEPGEDGAEVAVGMAVFFRTFSTWTGGYGIWLEDLYVRSTSRGGGHGKQLIASLAKLCADRGYPRLEWTVVEWNTPAIGFYRALGAVPMDDWTTQRLTGDALGSLASQFDGS
ncbi:MULTISPECIES: GNAT family N-acetyltransferase [Tsukamurella]|uniref:GNAT family N-acetyltransferase n=2 Tax=Tsukamurella strandjordii TaxID=147577 RepID=A0AA90SSR1_9ACTN|nr:MULTISPECIES: GNAT family N-acetyltransferase [Tsukamurella]MDP0400101.1 GNAT family N-acetyltransferase [Tsukamurella strandjordii]GIZ97102.1 putative acetyltransferase [Tsukamurella sp. TY48]